MVEAIRAAKAALDVPVFVKLSPLGREMVRAAEQAEAAGADGIVAINSFGPVLAIDPDTRLPLLGGSDGYGWLSGPAIKPLALRCVRDIARAVRVPVIGVGGVSHGIDAVEMLMAGASAVQVCTAAIMHGPARLREDRPRARPAGSTSTAMRRPPSFGASRSVPCRPPGRRGSRSSPRGRATAATCA